MSREEDPDSYITQLQADHGLQSYTTTTTPKSPSTSRAMLPFHGRGGRMGPPLVPPPQPGHHHQRSSPTSSGGQLLLPPQPGYPNVSVGSIDERSSKHRRVHDEQSPSGQSVAHQQQQITGYPTQQYQSQNQAHWYGSGAQPTNAPMFQPSQPTYGYSSTSAGPNDLHHAHHAYSPTRTAPMYAAPMYVGSVPTAPSQYGGTQGQEQYHYTGAVAYSQPTQAYQPPSYTLPTHAIGTHLGYTPTGSASSGSGSIRPIPPMTSAPMPPSTTVNRPLPSSAGSKGSAPSPSEVPHGDSSAQGQEYSLGPAGYSQLVQTQPYRQQPYTSATYATLAEVVPLANDTTSHISPRANLIVSGVPANSGAGPSSSNVNIGGATIGEPTSSNYQIGPSRRARTDRRQQPKPFKRPTSTSCKIRPITYEGNLVRLQQRCRGQGADEGAIGLLGKIFANGVSLEALRRLLTDAEAETNEFGIKTGMIYTALLEHPDEENDRYTCRLCHSEQTWKHHKDVLRHLNRDHFGISDDCDRWYVFVHWLMVAGVDTLLGM